jgi:hypothetical protein
MSDGRHKNVKWSVGEQPNMDGAQLTVLMDIRDELQTLNRILGCFRVRRMSDDINRIDRRIAKHLPMKKKGRAK